MKTEKFINALFAMVEAKMDYNNRLDKYGIYSHPIVKSADINLETAKQEFDKAFMEAVDSHIKETSKNQ